MLMLEKGATAAHSYPLWTVCPPTMLNPLIQLLHLSCPRGCLWPEETVRRCVLQVLRSYFFGSILFSLRDTALHKEIQALLLERVGTVSGGEKTNEKCTRDMGTLPAPAVYSKRIQATSISLVQLLSHVIIINKTVLILSHWIWG